MTTVPALTVATRFVAKHSQPPWWSLLSGCSRREPLAITAYRERGVGPICEEGREHLASAFRGGARLHAVAALNTDGASDDEQRSKLQCCTCDGEEGPCAVSEVVLFAVQEQNATFEPALVLRGQPIHQQRSAAGQRYTACGRRDEGATSKGREREREGGGELGVLQRGSGTSYLSGSQTGEALRGRDKSQTSQDKDQEEVAYLAVLSLEDENSCSDSGGPAP
ncbi:hypothetical protein EYF80_003184 [Liparis tanakae]|uniref:Uncharacterized protein n=1 Tax=Liparis tanakae TaxID=230148 RepID=A0A4Z2J9E9_9TELE|nr:hypothetical protein EYF80_003184 [Liparis tanakae]